MGLSVRYRSVGARYVESHHLGSAVFDAHRVSGFDQRRRRRNHTRPDCGGISEAYTTKY